VKTQAIGLGDSDQATAQFSVLPYVSLSNNFLQVSETNICQGNMVALSS